MTSSHCAIKNNWELFDTFKVFLKNIGIYLKLKENKNLQLVIYAKRTYKMHIKIL